MNGDPDAARVRQLSSREIYRNPWLTLREDEVEFADGSRGIYSVVEKPDFVVVLPYERIGSEDGFWLVQKFRYPVGTREWEFPQGGWPSGSSGSHEELAATELREETGFAAGQLELLGRLHAGYGFSTQGFRVYLATGLTPGEPQRETTESDMVQSWRSARELREMVRAGSFADSHSVAALTLYRLARDL